MATNNLKIGILASGGLGYDCLLYCLTNNWLPSFVATDSNSKNIIELATQNNIPCFKGNPRDNALSNFLNTQYFDVILSINYLFLIEEDVINKAKKVINFHGSLLPKYRGRTPHVWAIINNEKETGVTAHLIDKGCDTGDIILQKKITIDYNDTGAAVLAKYQNIYPIMLEEILLNIETLTPEKQNHNKATYFGKRTPIDGLINWTWQKERIYNWVRAQAKPYPGAFSFINNKKITIHKIGFTDVGFHCDDIDGKVIAFDNNFPIVKTQNGCVKLLEFDFEASIKINDILI